MPTTPPSPLCFCLVTLVTWPQSSQWASFLAMPGGRPCGLSARAPVAARAIRLARANFFMAFSFALIERPSQSFGAPERGRSCEASQIGCKQTLQLAAICPAALRLVHELVLADAADAEVLAVRMTQVE